MGLKENIKLKRLEHNLTLEDVAKSIGVSRQTVQKYESGIITNIPSDKIELLAKCLKTTPQWLMGWENNYSHPNNDIDIRRIERARQNMTQKEKDDMMKVLEISFKKYFTDNFVDTTDYSDEDND